MDEFLLADIERQIREDMPKTKTLSELRDFMRRLLDQIETNTHDA